MRPLAALLAGTGAALGLCGAVEVALSFVALAVAIDRPWRGL